jgi:hypothetical protein
LLGGMRVRVFQALWRRPDCTFVQRVWENVVSQHQSGNKLMPLLWSGKARTMRSDFVDFHMQLIGHAYE